MSGIWAALYVMTFVMPSLVLIISTVAVFRVARQLKGAHTDARPAWQYLALHLALGIGLALPLGPLALAAWLLVPGYLYRELRRGPTTSKQRERRPLTSGGSAKRHRGIATLFVTTGVLLPWATGLGVKVYLDSLGRPTLPLEGFLDPASVAIEVLLTLGAWAFPFVILASAVVVPWRIGFSEDSAARDSLLPIWLAYLFGVVATIPTFVGVFWEFDSLMLLVPVGLVLVPPMAVGYLIGWWMLRHAAHPKTPSPV